MSIDEHLCFDPDAPSGWTADDFARFVAEHTWIFAKTMPHNPHEYTLRRDTTTPLFESAVRYIREHGVMEQFAGKPYRTLFFADHKYWTMGSVLEKTILINRKLLPPADRPPQQSETKAADVIALRSSPRTDAARVSRTEIVHRLDLAMIRELFHGLIRSRACEGGLAVPEQLPELDDIALGDGATWFAVPGMHGGFAYHLLLDEDGELQLHVDSWSRVVGGSGMRHVVTATQVLLQEVGFV